MPTEPVFKAAGLYDANVGPKTGEKVDVYTMCTVPPNESLGTVHAARPWRFSLRSTPLGSRAALRRSPWWGCIETPTQCK